MNSKNNRNMSRSDQYLTITLLPPEMFTIRALEGVTAVGEEREVMRDIRRGLKDSELEESVTKAVEELKKTNLKSVRSAEWSETDGLLLFRGKFYVPPDPELRRRIVF